MDRLGVSRASPQVVSGGAARDREETALRGELIRVLANLRQAVACPLGTVQREGILLPIGVVALRDPPDH